MLNRFTLFSLSLLLAVSGCGGGRDLKLPGVYRINIQQGNVVEQDMLDKLKPGMAKNQVRFIMGTPAIIDPFHSDRWEYIYTFTYGGGDRHQRHITLYFEDEKLAYVDGDVVTALRKPTEEVKQQSKSIDVPLRERKAKGIFGRMVDKIPFVGDDDNPKPPKTEVIKDETAETAQGDDNISSDNIPEENTQPEKVTDSTEKEKKGFFGKLFGKLPFVDDEDTTSAEAPPETTAAE